MSQDLAYILSAPASMDSANAYPGGSLVTLLLAASLGEATCRCSQVPFVHCKLQG